MNTERDPADGSNGIRAFAISIADQDILDLRNRLRTTRWPDASPGAPWSEGTDLSYLRDLVDYWTNAYDWRSHESRLNRLPQFVTTIDANVIHFVHLRSGTKDAVPLIMTHGWPGSFAEFEAIAPMLTTAQGNGLVFDVVLPSIPGFGFSSKPSRVGMSQRRTAELWLELKTRLGYPRFGLQAGDFGAGISTWIARLAPERVIGLHLNFLPGSYVPQVDAATSPPTAAEIAFGDAATQWRETEGAYGRIHGTRPQSLAYALTDSPAGLAGWIVEKFRAWSDNEGRVESALSRNDMLTELSIYWFTRTIGSSMRFYLESRTSPLRLEAGERIQPPLGFASFPKETVAPPREWIERGFNLKRFTEMTAGGHFAAWEQPAALAADVRAFFGMIEA